MGIPTRSAATIRWHAAATASEVGRTPLGRDLAGVAIVLFRRRDGSLVALEDRCPHYLLPLSTGRLVDDDIECGYHDLRFDGTGACTYMPAQKSPPARFCVRSFPVEEREGQVLVAIESK